MAMATHTAESVTVSLPSAMPPMPAVARILARFDREHLSAFLEVAVDLLDAMDGDPEAEPATWGDQPISQADAFAHDDDEDDDPHGVADEDGINTGNLYFSGPGCIISDCGEDDDVDEEDDPSGVTDEDGVNTATATGTVWSRLGNPDLARPHIERVRRTRCDPIHVAGEPRWRLRERGSFDRISS